MEKITEITITFTPKITADGAQELMAMLVHVIDENTNFEDGEYEIETH